MYRNVLQTWNWECQWQGTHLLLSKGLHMHTINTYSVLALKFQKWFEVLTRRLIESEVKAKRPNARHHFFKRWRRCLSCSINKWAWENDQKNKKAKRFPIRILLISAEYFRLQEPPNLNRWKLSLCALGSNDNLQAVQKLNKMLHSFLKMTRFSKANLCCLKGTWYFYFNWCMGNEWWISPKIITILKCHRWPMCKIHFCS